MEEWKDVSGFENLYKISSKGKCWSKISNKLLEPHKYPNNYWFYSFNVKGVQKTRQIHRLVAEAFIPNLENKPCVGHKDCDRSNNCVENLYWCTYEENNNHPITRQRMSEGQRNSKKAFEASVNNFKKATEKIKRCVYQYSLDNILIKKYNSITEASKENDCFVQNICACCKGINKTCKGYKWSYYPL